ncbi:hypothetical protein [Pedobacter sp. UBA5917]|jgi:uncharacterized protein YdeI (BOF family)|uniref:hypothetical protein n=1 Tax=Pedobacter sp. UBA5917 TaxID=1947061 RepID=UPI0025FB9742|nr:hypothetical protein [Pedobacter sp. UBA5917]
MKKLIILVVFALISNMVLAQNSGIGTTSPTNKLHVKATSDPIRLEGLSNATSTSGTIVTDASGVLKIRNPDNISAVRITGNITLAADNTPYFNDVTEAPTETFDNLNEFSGHTFTAAQTGLYQVSFTTRYTQSTVFYGGLVLVYAGNGPTPPQYGAYDMGCINPPRAGFNFTLVSVTKSELIKLTAGQIMLFRMSTFGAIGNTNGSYVITINRID